MCLATQSIVDMRSATTTILSASSTVSMAGEFVRTGDMAGTHRGVPTARFLAERHQAIRCQGPHRVLCPAQRQALVMDAWWEAAASVRPAPHAEQHKRNPYNPFSLQRTATAVGRY